MLNLIGIHGKMGSGKNLVSEIIRDFTSNINFEEKAYASKIKDIASIITGLPRDRFEDRDFKKSLLPKEWSVPEKTILNSITSFKNVSFSKQMSIRELLQKIGTDCIRKNLHENVWINALFADYNNKSKWIITDVRFPDEIKAIKERNGIVIKKNGKMGSKNTHLSETALDEYEDWDYVVPYRSDIEELKAEVYMMLKFFKIL